MKIAVMGLGFVGLTTALGFAEKGHDVFGFDVNVQKTAELAAGTVSLAEPGLNEALKRHLDRSFTVLSTPFNASHNIDVVFICVGTPCDTEGNADLKYVNDALDALMPALAPNVFKGVVVIKSTVPPATTKTRIIPYLRERGITAPVANNPEFLREGHCWDDFMNPDRIVCGTDDAYAAEILEKVYGDFTAPVIITSLNTAEFIKYLSNTMLASMISFSNEMTMIAQAIGGISVKRAFEVLHMDKRWAGASMKQYVYPGCGFGGYCLPKDLQAMISKAKNYGINPLLLQSVQEVNKSVPYFFVNRIIAENTENIGILGLSFKPGSDDVRDSPAANIISALQGKKIYAYDPVANEAFKKSYNFDINYCESINEVCKRTKTVMIVTAWPQFKGIDKQYPDVKFIDGRYML